ncbi:MAG TPA: hypothetical protein DCW68_02125 [Rhodospirillaceae bacterium]|nr:MAG: hypothetical protein A2018_05090 [Alphaproteobacteria bacterium GWF2_58_20]HAU28892.1 hypothetical protein [Rhodospirillaceae bacterium]
MDTETLCQQLLEWKKSGKGDFPGGTVLREGPASFAFIPKDNPSCVVKLIKPGCKSHGLPVEEEYAMLQDLQELDGEKFVVPKPLGFGKDPDYLVMSREEGDAGKTMTPEDVALAGEALGEFAAKLYRSHKAVHTDLFCSNFMAHRQDGRIAILDIASISRSKDPEAMFMVPLVYLYNLSPLIASSFERHGGGKLDFGKIRKFGQRALDMVERSKSPESFAKIKAVFEKNMAEWEERRKQPVAPPVKHAGNLKP